MRDIAVMLVEASAELGRESRLRDDGGRPVDSDATNLVVAPHEFYLLGGYSDREIDTSARCSVPVATEQPGTTWFDITRLVCGASPTVLDINARGVDALRAEGLDAHHLRLGAVPSMHRRSDEGQRDIDLLFLGGRTDRRGARLAELAPLLWERSVELRLFSFSRPVHEEVGGVVFGRSKYELLARSRILLNLHRDDTIPGYFEWARMVEAMANGCCVVTEPSTGYEPLVAGEHFIETDDLEAALAELLDDPDRCAEIGRAGAEAVLEQYPLRDSLAVALERTEQIGWVDGGRSRRLVTRRYGSQMLRAQQIPLLQAFRPTKHLRRRIFDALTAEAVLLREIDQARCALHHGTDDHTVRYESTAYAGAEPEVSVIVTLHNYAHLVVETLDSIAASLDVNFEIVVIDDHSHDDGRGVVRAFIDRHDDVPMLLLGSDVNRGLPASRNLAIEQARADRIMVMDADNLIYPTALRRMSDALDADPGASFAYSTLEVFGTTRGVRSAMGWHVPWLCEGNYIDAQAMLRREAWERIDGYRTDDQMIFGLEDWELWLRLAAAGERGVHVAQMLGRYRVQEESMITTTNLVADHMYEHLREIHPTLPWPDVT